MVRVSGPPCTPNGKPNGVRHFNPVGFGSPGFLLYTGIMCNHDWIPLIAVDEHGHAQYGSLGSQIGYACRKCKDRDIRWPDGAYKTGVGETNVVLANRQRLA